MDIQERGAFEAEFSKIKSDIAFWVNTWDEDMQGYNHPVMCWFWHIWQAAKARAVPEWISVKDKLPPANMLVLGMSQTCSNIFNVYNVMALDEFKEFEVTHWMPLPDAPQEPAHD